MDEQQKPREERRRVEYDRRIAAPLRTQRQSRTVRVVEQVHAYVAMR